MEALQDQVQMVLRDLAELHVQQCTVIESRDHAKEQELEERLEELAWYRDHLYRRIEEETRTARELAALGPQPEVSLAYISFWKEPMSAQEVAYIGLYGRVANQKKRLTSCLLSIPQPGAFFQVIEGPEAAVDELYAKIARDPRHHRVSLLRRETISTRRFGGHALSVKSVDGIDEDYGVQLSPLLGSLLEAVSMAERYAPPVVTHRLAHGIDPLTEQGTAAELVVAFIGVQPLTVGSLRQLAGSVSNSPAASVAHSIGALMGVVHRRVAAVGGTCYPWIGNGMLVTFPTASANEAVECAVSILQEAAKSRTCYPLCVGVDAGGAFSTVCGRGHEALLLGLLGPPVAGAQEAAQEAGRAGQGPLLLTAACHRLLNKVDRQYHVAAPGASGPLFGTPI